MPISKEPGGFFKAVKAEDPYPRLFFQLKPSELYMLKSDSDHRSGLFWRRVSQIGFGCYEAISPNFPAKHFPWGKTFNNEMFFPLFSCPKLEKADFLAKERVIVLGKIEDTEKSSEKKSIAISCMDKFRRAMEAIKQLKPQHSYAFEKIPSTMKVLFRINKEPNDNFVFFKASDEFAIPIFTWESYLRDPPDKRISLFGKKPVALSPLDTVFVLETKP